jgi:hypothetical protein
MRMGRGLSARLVSFSAALILLQCGLYLAGPGWAGREGPRALERKTSPAIPRDGQADGSPNNSPNAGCEQESAQECVNLAIRAMGGRERLGQLKTIRLETIGHTLLAEQSYRQKPFITSYERARTTLDMANGRMRSETKLTWPEAVGSQSELDSVVIVARDGGVRQMKGQQGPCSLAELDAARDALWLGPARVLLTAAQAGDLHFAAPEMLRSTLHSVVAFTWGTIPVRIAINRFNHLPDAVEATRAFHDFWYFWGDVEQRVYFDNWNLFQGIVYPTNLVEERNGTVWRSTQSLTVEFDVPIQENDFRMTAATAQQSLRSPGWNRAFHPEQNADKELAPGIDLFLGAWNSTIVKQVDGIVILEAPISEPYTKGVIEEAKKRYPGMPIKAVLSTSDSWPHTGGVRFAVSEDLPVYILDLNQPLLDRMVAAPHKLDPDDLEHSGGAKRPDWQIVSAKVQLGTGPNRIELYPLRGASTERQYMAYFPEHRLLYASDTLALNDDNSLYDPELMNEVAQAVKRENLQVDTVFSMHQGPMAWKQVVEMIGR